MSADGRPSYEELAAENAELRAMMATLRGQVVDLTRRAGQNSRNSSNRPSSDSPFAKPAEAAAVRYTSTIYGVPTHAGAATTLLLCTGQYTHSESGFAACSSGHRRRSPRTTDGSPRSRTRCAGCGVELRVRGSTAHASSSIRNSCPTTASRAHSSSGHPYLTVVSLLCRGRPASSGVARRHACAPPTVRVAPSMVQVAAPIRFVLEARGVWCRVPAGSGIRCPESQ
ncbi:DUF6444 domain-containing protein [Amycolatopsis sp. GM8]|uniref:DUF6444 domain-containing protein n=1 Tax=Amycolatopsis sp. GM8 TaxID=2896530 RepID=UPI0035ABAAE3